MQCMSVCLSACTNTPGCCLKPRCCIHGNPIYPITWGFRGTSASGPVPKCVSLSFSCTWIVTWTGHQSRGGLSVVYNTRCGIPTIIFRSTSSLSNIVLLLFLFCSIRYPPPTPIHRNCSPSTMAYEDGREKATAMPA